VSSAAYRRHVPRQWRARVTGEKVPGRRVWAGDWYVNATTAAQARAAAIKRTRTITGPRFRKLRATVKLANR
jgi:hypothetical protein